MLGQGETGEVAIGLGKVFRPHLDKHGRAYNIASKRLDTAPKTEVAVAFAGVMTRTIGI